MPNTPSLRWWPVVEFTGWIPVPDTPTMYIPNFDFDIHKRKQLPSKIIVAEHTFRAFFTVNNNGIISK